MILSIQVVIVTYKDRFSFLKKVVESLTNQNVVTDILIVDNGCEYDLCDVIFKEFQTSKVRVSKVDKPVGTSKAFELAFNNINHDCSHVLLLDDDNVLEGDLYEIKDILSSKKIINLLRRDREPYCNSFEKKIDLKLINNSFNGFSIYNYFFSRVSFFSSKNKNCNKSKIISSEYLPFGGSIFPVDLLKQVHLNLNFILYHDDIDFFYRARMVGYSLEITNICTTLDIDFSWHDKSEKLLDSIKRNPNNVYYAIRNKIFFEKTISNSTIIFNINMFIWRSVFLIKNIKKLHSKECIILKKAMNDGINGRLGVFEE